jgi:hypothetical protein
VLDGARGRLHHLLLPSWGSRNLTALGALGGGLLARLASDAQDTDPTAQYRLAFFVTAALAATSGLIAVAITESPRRRSGTARSTLRCPR